MLSAWCGSVFSWCGLATFAAKKEAPLHQPLDGLNNNLKLRRHCTSKPVGSDDSDESDDQQDAESTSTSGEFIRQRDLHTFKPMSLVDPSAVPPTVPVTVQPVATAIHRPDLAKSLGSPSHSGAFIINTIAAQHHQGNVSDQDDQDDSASTISTSSTIPRSLSRSGSIRRSAGRLHKMKRYTKSANDLYAQANLTRGLSSSRISLSSFDGDVSPVNSICSLTSNAMSSDAGSVYSERILSDTASVYSETFGSVLQEEEEEEHRLGLSEDQSLVSGLKYDDVDYSLLDASLSQSRKSLSASTFSLASSTQGGRRNHQHRKPHPKFLTPEQASAPHISPNQSSSTPKKPSTLPKSTKLKEYDQSSGDSSFSKLGTTLLSPFREPKPDYVGEIEIEGNSTPVKLRSRFTMQAIGAHRDRKETKENPIRYSFGQLILALRYGHIKDRLEVAVIQATELPPGVDRPHLDIKISVVKKEKSSRSKWLKSFEHGPKLFPEDNSEIEKHCSHTDIKVKDLSLRALLISVWLSGVQREPHLAVGHGLIPELVTIGLQPDPWSTFTLQLHHGTKIQNHRGRALVALSCFERTLGTYTFTVDVMKVMDVRANMLGDVGTSSKVKARLHVRAYAIIEDKASKKQETPATSLKPGNTKGVQDQVGWEAVFSSGCTTQFDVPKNKINVTCIMLEMVGAARIRVTTKEKELGFIMLGPHQWFGGEDLANTQSISGVDMMAVPGDPLDSRLTHWGQTLTRKAKVEMWHRLQM